jgi:hypothetical protein
MVQLIVMDWQRQWRLGSKTGEVISALIPIRSPVIKEVVYVGRGSDADRVAQSDAPLGATYYSCSAPVRASASEVYTAFQYYGTEP